MTLSNRDWHQLMQMSSHQRQTALSRLEAILPGLDRLWIGVSKRCLAEWLRAVHDRSQSASTLARWLSAFERRGVLGLTQSWMA